MARRELYEAEDMADQPATLEQLAELRSDINQALQQISAQLSSRPNPAPRAAQSAPTDAPLMAQLFALQSEMREQARSENERLRDEIRELQVREDPIDEIDRAQRLVQLLPQEKDETKEMIMGALGMLAEVMTRDTQTDPEPTATSASGNEGDVQGEHFRSEESDNTEEHTGAGRAVTTDFGVVLVED